MQRYKAVVGLMLVVAASGCAGSEPAAEPAVGTRPTTVPASTEPAVTTTTLPGPPMPTDADVGPDVGSELTEVEGTDIVPGRRYDDVEIVGQVDIGSDEATTTFTNCRIDGTIVTYSPLVLDACEVTGGVFAYDTEGTITDSLLRGINKAFRPGTTSMSDAYTTPTPWRVSDTIIRVEQGIAPAHTDATQVLGGVGITFDNVVFEAGGPFNNTQTSDLSFIGADLLCQDCWFMGYGGFSVYGEGPNNRLVRPRFGPNAEYGKVYPDAEQLPEIIDPIELG